MRWPWRTERRRDRVPEGDEQPVVPDRAPEGDEQPVVPDRAPEGDEQPVVPDRAPEGDEQPVVPDRAPEGDEQPVVPDRALVFVHLPKCGGTAIHDWLTAVVDPAVFSPERNRMPIDLSADRAAQMRQHLVFSGHYDSVDVSRLPAPRRTFTVLRDPVDRLVSLYDFWRAHAPDHVARHDLAGPRFAASVTFDEFVGAPDPTVVHDLDNTYVRTFTGLVRSPDPIGDPRAAIEDARAFLAALDHVGTVDTLESTLDWLRAELGVVGPGLGRSNVRGEWTQDHLVNVDRTIPSPAALTAIEPLVALDRELIGTYLSSH